MRGGPWPSWATVLAVSLGLLGLAALYVAGLRLVVDTSMPGQSFDANERDASYAIVHGTVVIIALIVGFALGRLARRQGLAWAVLFVSVMLALMAGVMIGSRELACEADVNDLVRHWECSRSTTQ